MRQSVSNVTKRSTVEPLEAILYDTLQVLDHGFIRVIDYMGDDSAVVQAARVSYGKGTKHCSKDRGLINYLMLNNHTTPFEMCEIKLHVKLPIFVARQWVRHRTASINEYSARYSILDKEFYVPNLNKIAKQSTQNNQGRAGVPLPDDIAQKIQNLLTKEAINCYDQYEHLLNEDLARELARMTLSANFYTQWYWKTNLHNLLRFVKLRNDQRAQYEIRQYAEQILKIMKGWVPMTYDAFMEYNMGSVRVSRSAKRLLRDNMKKGVDVNCAEYGISPREWRDLDEMFEITK